jgi:hypothetical protein
MHGVCYSFVLCVMLSTLAALRIRKDQMSFIFVVHGF